MAYFFRLIGLFFCLLSFNVSAQVPTVSQTEYSADLSCCSNFFPSAAQACSLRATQLDTLFNEPGRFSSQSTSTSCAISDRGGPATGYGFTIRTVLACPSNSTLSGSSCTCNSGHEPNGTNTGCIPVCPAGQIRGANGSCGCPAGQTLFDGACIVLQCPENESLVSGVCVPNPCPSGQTRINGVCRDNGCPKAGTTTGSFYSLDSDATEYLCEPYNSRLCSVRINPGSGVFWFDENGNKVGGYSGEGFWTGSSCNPGYGSSPPSGNGGGGSGGPGPGGSGSGSGSGSGGDGSGSGDGGTGSGGGGTGSGSGTGGTGSGSGSGSGGTGSGSGSGDSGTGSGSGSSGSGSGGGGSGTGVGSGGGGGGGGGPGGGPRPNPNPPPPPVPQDPQPDGSCPSGSSKINGSCIKNPVPLPPPTPENPGGVCPPDTTRVGSQCVYSVPPPGKGQGDGDSQGDGQGDGQGGSGFGGSCQSGFTCEGDAVQCATAKAVNDQLCLFEMDQSTKDLVGDILGGTAVEDPRETAEDFEVGVFDQDNPFGASCPGDISANVNGFSMVIPLGSMCSWLQIIGNMLVAVSLFGATLFVVRGGNT